MNRLRIAHLSDPHFTKITYSPTQFLSKRWLGNLNVILHRRHIYHTDHLWHLSELIQSLQVEHVCITGDFSSTALNAEFAEAKKWVETFHQKGLHTSVIPGNHDYYTRRSEKQKRYFTFFPDDALRSKRVTCTTIKEGWWYVALDCAVATPPFLAYGVFSEAIERNLTTILQAIPKTDRVILANHFPLFTTGRSDHDLRGTDRLQDLLKQFPQITLYLHGHDHIPYIIDKQTEGLPLTLNSGSCARRLGGSFYLIDLGEKECLVQTVIFHEESGAWSIDKQMHYDLKI